MMEAIREYLRPWVAGGTPTVARVQRFMGVTKEGPTIAWLHALMVFGAGLGNELFFIIFIPWLFWEFDATVSRRLVYLWVSSYYIGQMAKDLVSLPRPPASVVIDATGFSSVMEAYRRGKKQQRSSSSTSPTAVTTEDNNSVVRLERHYETEGGMPSTHTMNAFSMPWILAYVAYTAGPEHCFVSGELLLGVAIVWCLLCTSSRLYMGVHSPADMIVGFVLGIAMLALHIVYGEVVDRWVTGEFIFPLQKTLGQVVYGVSSILHQQGVVLLTTIGVNGWQTQEGTVDVLQQQQLEQQQQQPDQIIPTYIFGPLICVLLAFLYPRPSSARWVSTPGDTCIILGAAAGVMLGTNLFVREAATGDVSNTNTAAAIALPAIQRRLMMLPTLASFPGMIVRIVVGFIIIVLSRAMSKSICTAVLVAMLPDDLIPASQAESEGGNSGERHAGVNSSNNTSSAALTPTPPTSLAKRDSLSLSSLSSTTTTNNNSATGCLRQRRPYVDLNYEDQSQSVISNSVASNKADSSTTTTTAINPTKPVMQIRNPSDIVKSALPPSSSLSSSASAATTTASASANQQQTTTSKQQQPTTATEKMVKVHPSRRYSIELPVKLVTYALIGIHSAYTCQLLFQRLPWGYDRQYGF